MVALHAIDLYKHHRIIMSKSKTFFPRRLIVLCLLTLAALHAQDVRTPAVSFLMVSDIGGRGSPDQRAVAAAMGKEAARVSARFVVTAGDNYHEDGIASASDPRWKVEFEDVYAHPALQIPWYPSLGNHDYRGNVDAEIEYSNLSGRWKLTSRYYAQKVQIDDTSSLLIVHLDTSPFLQAYQDEPGVYHLSGQNASIQLRWLDSVLSHTEAQWRIVVGHHPIYAAAPKLGDTKELVDGVLPDLKNHGVSMYVSGHDHILQHLKRDSIDFVICGGGAKHRETEQREDVVFGVRSLGFVSVTATAGELVVNYVDSANTLLHSFTRSSSPAK